MRVLILGLVAVAVLPAAAGAQQPPRRQAPIEIRGTVPTPQVVTVRPREVPAYDRRVLVPAFYDHDFWGSILPGYLVVRQQMLTGVVPAESLARRDTAGTMDPATGLRRDTTGAMVPPAGAVPPPAGPPATAMAPPRPADLDGTRRAIPLAGVPHGTRREAPAPSGRPASHPQR